MMARGFDPSPTGLRSSFLKVCSSRAQRCVCSILVPAFPHLHDYPFLLFLNLLSLFSIILPTSSFLYINQFSFRLLHLPHPLLYPSVHSGIAHAACGPTAVYLLWILLVSTVQDCSPTLDEEFVPSGAGLSAECIGSFFRGPTAT